MIRQSGSSRINTRPRTNTTDDIDLGYPSDILTKINTIKIVMEKIIKLIYLSFLVHQ